MTCDLTRGKPLRMIIRFVIPVLLGLLLQQVYSIVDTAIVGHALGVMALGGVGATGAMNYLILGFCGGLCVGMAIPLAQTFGAGDYRRLRVYVANCVWLGIALSVLMLVITLPLCRPLLTVMGTQPEQLEYAFDYIFIIFCGIPAVILYNMGACVLRSLGDSKSPIWFLALASVINIVLDFLSIYGLHMGVAGAATATVVSQLVSGLLCIWYIKKRFPILQMSKEEWAFDRDASLHLLSMGVPVGLQCSITAIGSVILQTAVNSLGAVCVSGVATSAKIYQLFACPYDALGMTATNYVGQNFGAGKFDRIRRGVGASMLIGLVYCVVHILLMQFCLQYAMLLFMSAEEMQLVLPYTQMIARIEAYSAPLLLAVNVLRLSIQGMGYSRLALVAGLMEMIARTLMGAWAVPKFGFIAACLASPLAWLLADLFLIPAFFGCLRAREENAQAVRAMQQADEAAEQNS